MISNYLHDLSVALLAANILVIYFLGRYLDKKPIKDEIISNLFKKLSVISYIVLGYILLGGAFRAYFFMEYEWNPAVGKGQITALIIKHIILFLITAYGIVVYLKYVRKYGR
jgi:hypothetical protein